MHKILVARRRRARCGALDDDECSHSESDRATHRARGASRERQGFGQEKPTSLTTGCYPVTMNDKSIIDVLLDFQRIPESEMIDRGRAFREWMATRRSVRKFSSDPVPRELVELAIAAAHTAPSGANRQPWHFVAVSDPEIKAAIRSAAEAEEREFYEGGRATEEWLTALEPLGTGWRKPYLEIAPWLVAVFKEIHGVGEDGQKITNYYVNESVGIACGLFIAALHHMGLATLTHTPQPMRFLNRILDRPSNERPFILFPIGYPAEDCRVPDISKKPLQDVVTWMTK